MMTRCSFLSCCAFALLSLGTAPALAQQAAASTLSPEQKVEARRRFDRGLALYNQGDLNGALAEFRLAHKLTGHPVVLYNLALVLAGLGHSAEAVEALEKLQAPQLSAELGAQRAQRARQVYEEQLLRVGTLEVRSNVPRAQVQIDSLDVARTPAAPVRVTAGSHVVSLSAPQHEPQRVSISVAGRASEVLELELRPLEQALAHFTATSSVPDVEVRANGELVGRTPFASDLAFRPGSYELEFSRPGYVAVRRRVELDPGSVGKLEVKMVPSDAGLAAGGLLELRLSERDTVVNVDGEPRLDHTRGLTLPVGRHQLRIQRAGFHDVEREAWVKPGRQSLDVTLLPTPAYLADYVQSAETQRLWGFVALGSGALLAGGSAGFLLWNQGQKREAERDFDAYADRVAQGPSGQCPDDDCERQLGILVDELDARRGRDVFGWAGLSVGAVALGVGAFVLLRAPDPKRYEPKPESDVFGGLDVQLQPSGLRLNGTF
jgi:tetratricopeptide (TPR) repeat protein